MSIITSNNITVLVVDDSPESLSMLNATLNQAGLTVLVALNGVQALTIVQKVQPDVILLDAIMPEMDGFDTNEGVILMAATNRPDVLDKALLRPGRFDRNVMLDLPDIKGRFDILKVHARKIKLDPSVDLMDVARATPGSSGADLMNILNEAALLAARKGRSAVTQSDTLEACDKVKYGKERPTP